MLIVSHFPAFTWLSALIISNISNYLNCCVGVLLFAIIFKRTLHPSSQMSELLICAFMILSITSMAPHFTAFIWLSSKSNQICYLTLGLLLTVIFPSTLQPCWHTTTLSMWIFRASIIVSIILYSLAFIWLSAMVVGKIGLFVRSGYIGFTIIRCDIQEYSASLLTYNDIINMCLH